MIKTRNPCQQGNMQQSMRADDVVVICWTLGIAQLSCHSSCNFNCNLQRCGHEKAHSGSAGRRLLLWHKQACLQHTTPQSPSHLNWSTHLCAMLSVCLVIQKMYLSSGDNVCNRAAVSRQKQIARNWQKALWQSRQLQKSRATGCDHLVCLCLCSFA